MITAVIIALILTLIYNIALIKKNKRIPISLSHSYYIFGGYPKGYIFYGYLVTMFFLLIIPMIEITSEKWAWIPFLALASICFVGAAADFLYLKQTRIVHTVGAIITSLLSLLWCIVVGYWYIGLCSIAIASVIAYLFRNKIYWLEMGCFASVFIILLILI